MKKWLQKMLGVDTLIAELKKENNNIVLDVDSGLNDNYLFDFKQGWRGGGYTINGIMTSEGSIDVDSNTEKTIKIKVKPIDVLDELETMPTPFSLDLIDEKIEILKDKKELIRQDYTKRELTALIERLENRKIYTEHREFFEQFGNTTEEKIKALTTKHGLVMETADIFIPEFPDEAVNIMLSKNPPDIIAHLDLVEKFNKNYKYFNSTEKWYKNLIFETIDHISETNSIVELNSRSKYKGLLNNYNPNTWIIKEIKNKKTPVTISGDVHKPEELDLFWNDSVKHLKTLGFTQISLLNEQGWQLQKIN